MLLTYQEIQDSDISNIVSCGTDTPDFGQYIFGAVQRLLPRGDWAGTVVPVHTCVNRGCVVWPRYVDHVRHLSHCGGNIPVHGLFYDFLDWQDKRWRDQIARYGGRGRRNLVNKGWSPVFQDILGPGRTVRLYHTAPEDIGATVTLFGVDNNNQKLQTRNSNGLGWTPGITLTAAYPYAETPIPILRIDRVVRSKTQAVVRLYGVTYPGQNIFPQQIGSVYNMDTGAWITVTALGPVGAQYLQLGAGAPPANTMQIGYLYNYDLGSWQPVVARGIAPNFYLDFTQTTAVNNTFGGSVFNLASQSFSNIVLRGQLGVQYLDIGDFAPPTSVLQASGGTLEPIAEYEPGDINPRFLKTELHLPCAQAPSGQGIVNGQHPPQGIVALVKLRQILPVAPTDLIVIPSTQAIKLAVQAIIAGEANDIQTETEYMAAAVQQLNRELEDWLPLDQIPVDLGELGHTHAGRQKCF